jgi:3',5'-cyclic AMP phosphodiesterase CpdA
MQKYAILLVAALPWLHAADTLIGGPYVIHVTRTSATVAWILQSADVKLGTAPDRLDQVEPALRWEHVTYSNLKPGTTYYYDVLDRDEGKGRFKTPPSGATPFQFVVYGDTRTRHDFHRKVVAAIANAEPDFVVHTGDLVSDGAQTSLWPIFFSIEKELLRKTVFFPSLGNHERNNPQYYQFFDVKNPYYSFNWGNAHFTVLNSDLGNAAADAAAKAKFWAAQKQWLEADLQASQKAAFRFLVFHHPPFTAYARRQKEISATADFVPLFEQYKVTAVFNGHDHNYQHHVKNGIHYIVTGGGGAPLYPVDAPIPAMTKRVESTEHFVKVNVNGNQARVEAVALDGHLIDTIDLGAAQ